MTLLGVVGTVLWILIALALIAITVANFRSGRGGSHRDKF